MRIRLLGAMIVVLIYTLLLMGCGGKSSSPSTPTTPTPSTCSVFTYSNWGACQPDSTQTRTVLVSSPSGCAGGSPVTTQACTYFPPLTGNPCDATILGFSSPIQGIHNGADCTAQATRSSVVFLGGYFSGTVISDQWVLTAGHAFGPNPSPVGVALGSGSPMMSTEIHVKPGGIYNGTIANDVAVIKFPRSLGRRIVPLLLSRNANSGEPGVVLGFGEVTPGIGKGVLRATFVTILQTDSIGWVRVVNQSSSDGVGCSGDSGGPLLVSLGGEYVIAGIASGASPLCGPGTSSFTSVKIKEISDFILQYVPDAIRR